MIVRELLIQNKIALAVIFFLLLTIILYGLAKVVIKMVFSPLNKEKALTAHDPAKELNWTMYIPQIIMLVLVFALGLYMPKILFILINLTTIGF